MAKKEKEPKEKKEKKPKKEKKEKAPKEKKSKVKKVKKKESKGDKPDTKGKKGKKGKGDDEEDEGGGGGGKKKLIILIVILLVLLAAGGAAAYFLVLKPVQDAEAALLEEAENSEVVTEDMLINKNGFFGYLSHNGVGTNEYLIDSVDMIYATDYAIIESLSITEDQMALGYYISNPQTATRLIYSDGNTIYTIISPETGEYKDVSHSDFLAYLSTGAVLFQIESTNNTLTSVREFDLSQRAAPVLPEASTEDEGGEGESDEG